MTTNDINFNVNFYEVLGLEPTATMQEIKKQYGKLIVKYHPDKAKESFDPSLFELIQKAYETLSNSKKREEYDFYVNKIVKSRTDDFIKLKNDFEKYMELEELQTKDENSKIKAKIEFDRLFNECDDKHGFKRDKIQDKLSEEEIKNQLDDLVLQREQDEIEFSQNKLFDDGESFDISKFNAAFDLYKSSSDKQLSKTNKVSAFNFDGPTRDLQFGDLNSYGSIYDESTNDFEGNTMFSSVNLGKANKLDKNKIKNINSVTYTHDYNKNRDTTYIQDLESKIKQREEETFNIENMTIDDFDKDCQDFSFTHDLGITPSMIDWNSEIDDEEIKKSYRKLLELESKNKTKK
jgi:curved DNA-binding protein CbpA